MASKSKTAGAEAKPVYVNQKAIVLSGGPDKGKSFAPGVYKGSLDHLGEADIKLLLVTGVIKVFDGGES